MANTETLTIASEAGRNYDAYLARPSETRAVGVLVLHDMFGLNAPIRGYADGLAQRGFAALVPICSGAPTLPARSPMTMRSTRRPGRG